MPSAPVASWPAAASEAGIEVLAATAKKTIIAGRSNSMGRRRMGLLLKWGLAFAVEGDEEDRISRIRPETCRVSGNGVTSAW
jgi:hypothetical protein